MYVQIFENLNINLNFWTKVYISAFACISDQYRLYLLSTITYYLPPKRALF